MNNIVTRGFGNDSTIITRGFGDKVLRAVKEAARLVKGSAAEARDQFRRTFVTVRAALVEVNDRQFNRIKGADKGYIDKTDMAVKAKFTFSSVYKGLKEIFIRALGVSSKRHRSD